MAIQHLRRFKLRNRVDKTRTSHAHRKTLGLRRIRRILMEQEER